MEKRPQNDSHKKSGFSPERKGRSCNESDSEPARRGGESGNEVDGENVRDADEDEELHVLTFNALRIAFASVESQEIESGFQWGAKTSRRKDSSPAPHLSVFDGTPPSHDTEESEKTRLPECFDDPDDFSDVNREESGNTFFEDDENFEKTRSSPASEGETQESENETAEEEIDVNPLTLFESMLFVGNKENRPLSPEKASELMRNVSPEEIDELAGELNRRYTIWNCPYEIVRETSGFRMTLRDDFESVRTKFYGRIKEARLTQSAIDVLSLVAYKQPITAEEVQRLRKQPSVPILSQLVRRDLIGIVRENEDKRRKTYYTTTERFLRLFGLETLDDLPVSDEIEDML